MTRSAPSSFVTVRDHSLEFQRYPGQAPDAPTIVMLHEGLGSVSMWRDFPRRVADATLCPVVVFSRYGYGQSDALRAPFTVRYMHEEALEGLPDFLDALGIEEPAVLAIQGRDDDYGTLAQLDAIERQAGGPVKRLVLDHCGHAPHRDQPAAVIDAVSNFVAAVVR